MVLNKIVCNLIPFVSFHIKASLLGMGDVIGERGEERERGRGEEERGSGNISWRAHTKINRAVNSRGNDTIRSSDRV